MKQSVTVSFLITLVILFSTPPAFAKKVKVKLGTFAPESTFWVKDLKKMGNQWKKLSKGKVRLRVYSGGVSGDEPATVRKMIIGQLSAATLTTIGLSEIVPDTLVLSTPFLYKSDQEVNHVMTKVIPNLEQQFEKKGFKVLHWTSLGWVYLFSKEKVVLPKHLAPLPLYVGSPEGSDIYKVSGFKTEEISPLELLKALSPPFPMVSAYTTSPIYSLANQWFGLAKNMMDYPLSPAIAATVIRKDIWEKIPADLHPEFIRLAQGISQNAELKMKQFDEAVKEAMVNNGLQIHSLSPQQKKQWDALFEKSYPLMKKKVSANLFTQIETLLDGFRSQSSK